MCAPSEAPSRIAVAWQLAVHACVFVALRLFAGAMWEQKPFRRYTNWNLITYGACLLELFLLRRSEGRSLLAAFVTTNSVAVCFSFYVGVFLLDWEIFIAWTQQELAEFASVGKVDATHAAEDLFEAVGESEQGSWLPFAAFWDKLLPELQDGINHPLEFAAAFHLGSFLLHVVPAIVAWRSLAPRAKTAMPWWVIGLVSSTFHMAWAMSVNGSLYLNDVYFNAPDHVWWGCWVSGSMAHLGTAYLLFSGEKERAAAAKGKGPKAESASETAVASGAGESVRRSSRLRNRARRD